MFCNIIYLAFEAKYGGIAQLARAFGSYPKCRRFKSYFRYHIRPGGQAVKTPPFHGGNTSSILVRVTKHLYAGVVEQADTRDLKSLGLILRTGSSPVTGTKKMYRKICLFLFLRYFLIKINLKSCTSILCVYSTASFNFYVFLMCLRKSASAVGIERYNCFP